VLFSRNVLVQILALAVLSALMVFLCVVRERRRRQLAQVCLVAEAAQHVLLWPLPERIGPLTIACLYLAAEDEAQIGGDLYAATRSGLQIRLKFECPPNFVAPKHWSLHTRVLVRGQQVAVASDEVLGNRTCL